MPWLTVTHDLNGDKMPEPSPLDAPAHAISRREFVVLIWKGLLWMSGILGGYITLRFLAYLSPDATPAPMDLGPISDLPSNEPTLLPHASAILIPTEGGIKALSLECTHLGCQVTYKRTHFVCPCHGSEFAIDGTVIKGPADRPLQTLDLETSADGHLILLKGG